MKIDLYASHGSPEGIIPDDLYERGIGGAELALVTQMEHLARAGHDVRVYNNPRAEGVYSGVHYLPRSSFSPKEDRDVFVVFRAPTPLVRTSKGKKVFWSCDQFTVGNFSTDVFPFVDEIVVISEFHKDFFKRHYGLSEDRMTIIGLGVREEDYTSDVEKIRNRVIFCSVPERGLSLVRQAWPIIIRDVPEASLCITSDYRLWGLDNPNNYEYRMSFVRVHGVDFKGMIPRRELCTLQQQAEIMLYPCVYDELFCISAAECQVAGAVPITSTKAALATTNRYGIQLDHLDPGLYAKEVVELLTTRREELESRREMCEDSIRGEFSWKVASLLWEEVLR